MRDRTRTIALAGVVALAASVLVVAPIQARGERSGVRPAATFDSTVGLYIKDHFRFKGKVSSGAHVCVASRKVWLIRVEPDDSHTKVTSTFTNGMGYYSTQIPQQAGNHFFARVNRKVTAGGTICRADSSPVKTV